MKPPIIIVGDGQVEVFSSLNSLKQSLEAVDAELYQAYDSDGQALQLNGHCEEGSWLGIRWLRNGTVTLDAYEEPMMRVDELRRALLDWWNRTGGKDDASNWSLEELLAAIVCRDGVK